MSPSPQPGEDFLDRAGGTTTLTARVVDVYGDRARIHGFDVDRDLASVLGPTGLLLTTWLGEIPSPEQIRLLDVARTLAAPFGVHEAPVHAAVIARACGADDTAVLSTALVVLAQRCGSDVRIHSSLLAWLAKPQSATPPACGHADTCDEAALEQLQRIDSPMIEPLRTVHICRTGWSLSLATCAGIVTGGHLEAFLALARLPALVAEAMAAPRGDLSQIPINLPAFQYQP